MNGPSQQPLQKSEARPPALRQIIATQFSGPLPPPEVLARYDQIVPGSARRILTMAEKQAGHRQAIEKTVIHSDVVNSRVGLVFGLVSGLGGLVAATIISLYGNPTTGGVIGFTTIASMVAAFVYGSRLRKEERTLRRHERDRLLGA